MPRAPRRFSRRPASASASASAASAQNTTTNNRRPATGAAAAAAERVRRLARPSAAPRPTRERKLRAARRRRRVGGRGGGAPAVGSAAAGRGVRRRRPRAGSAGVRAGRRPVRRTAAWRAQQSWGRAREDASERPQVAAHAVRARFRGGARGLQRSAGKAQASTRTACAERRGAGASLADVADARASTRARYRAGEDEARQRPQQGHRAGTGGVAWTTSGSATPPSRCVSSSHARPCGGFFLSRCAFQAENASNHGFPGDLGAAHGAAAADRDGGRACDRDRRSLAYVRRCPEPA